MPTCLRMASEPACLTDVETITETEMLSLRTKLLHVKDGYIIMRNHIERQSSAHYRNATSERRKDSWPKKERLTHAICVAKK
jgi:hypothetical protein